MCPYGHLAARAPTATRVRSCRRGDDRVSTPPEAAAVGAASGERLQKVLAATGWGSRRVCEELIAAGRVRVNGEVAVLGRRVDPEHDLVEVDGAPVGVRPGLVYYLLNKPAGVVTTARDTHGRRDRGRSRAGRAAGVPGRSARRRHRGSAAAHQRRRAGQPRRPPVGGRREGVPRRRRDRRRPQCRPGGHPHAPRGGRPRRRRDGAGEGDPALAGSAADRHPRRTQPADPADVRSGRPSCSPARPCAHRSAHRPPAEAGEWRELTTDEVRRLAVGDGANRQVARNGLARYAPSR